MKTIGLGSTLTMKVLGIGVPELFVLLMMVAPIALYVLFVRPGAPYAHSTAFGRHLNFDHYHLDTIMKVLYMFSFIVNITLGVMTFLALMEMNSDFAFLSILAGILVFMILQGLSRMMHEIIIVYVHMAEDVRGVREGLGYARPAKKTVSPEAAARAARRSAARKEAVSSFKRSVRQSDVVRSALGSPTNDSQPPIAYTPETNQEQWVCPNCGTTMPSGKFCTKCGTPRA